jgi:AAA domain
LIIAPYNAQVFEIQERIPSGRVGTVDKFQGQEAPIVIYSITTDHDLKLFGRSPRHGISIQLEPLECRNLSREGGLRAGGFTSGFRGRMPNATTDAACERLLPVLGDGDRNLTHKHGKLHWDRFAFI